MKPPAAHCANAVLDGHCFGVSVKGLKRFVVTRTVRLMTPPEVVVVLSTFSTPFSLKALRRSALMKKFTFVIGKEYERLRSVSVMSR